MSGDNSVKNWFYLAAKFFDDYVLEPTGAKKYTDEWGVTNLVQKSLGDEGLVEGLKDFATDDFMKKYGYVGAATMFYFSMCRGWGFKSSMLMTGIASAAFAHLIMPAVAGVFNSTAPGGPGAPAQSLPVNQQFLPSSPQP